MDSQSSFSGIEAENRTKTCIQGLLYLDFNVVSTVLQVISYTAKVIQNLDVRGAQTKVLWGVGIYFGGTSVNYDGD